MTEQVELSEKEIARRKKLALEKANKEGGMRKVMKTDIGGQELQKGCDAIGGRTMED